MRRSELVIDNKSDESPVTIADREAEAAMRRVLSQRQIRPSFSLQSAHAHPPHVTKQRTRNEPGIEERQTLAVRPFQIVRPDQPR